MTKPRSNPSQPHFARGLRLLDLVGFVAGFGLTSLLARTIWPRFFDLAGPPVVAFALEFFWLGLAMSGPIILGLDPRRPSRSALARPDRPGRLIGEVVAMPRAQQPPVREPSDETAYSRAELAWMAIGGYWIALTFFVVPARATNAPWTLAGLIPIVAAFLVMVFIPRRREPPGDRHLGWTHVVAVGLLWTWPLAWGLLVLLSRTI